MEIITRYRTKHGQEFKDEAEARRIEALTDLAIEIGTRVADVMNDDDKDSRSFQNSGSLNTEERGILTPREIREELDRQGISQNALAKKAGVARSLICMILKGQRPLTPETEVKLFMALYGEEIPF